MKEAKFIKKENDIAEYEIPEEAEKIEKWGNMKIAFELKNLNKLSKMKDAIDEVLNINFEELELTEENIKKAISIKEKIKGIKKLYWDFEGIDVKIISSEGTELTKIN